MKKILIILSLIAVLFSQNIDCVGNSITANGYPEIVDFWMKADNYEWTVFNFGVPGAGIITNAYKNTIEYNEVLQRESEHIVMKLGTNDVSGYANMDDGWRSYWEFEYRELVNKFRYVSDNVFLGTIIYQLYYTQNKVIDEMNKIIKKIANEYGLVIIDFNLALGMNIDYFQADGIHPSTNGKYKLARVAFDILKTYPTLNLRIDNEYWEAVKRDKKDSKQSGCSFKPPTSY